MTRYSGDPYWTQARWPGRCAKCGATFAKGASIYYYPNGRKVYFGTCAEAAAADFNAHKADEELEAGPLG
jgi:hypothetical protein